MEEFLASVRAFGDQPVGPGAFALFVGIVFLFEGLVIGWDRWRTGRKFRAFATQYPDAALVYLYVGEEPATWCRINGQRGTVSPVCILPAQQHPAGRKGLAFYAAPGVTTVNLLLRTKKGEEGGRRISGQISFRAEAKGVYRAQLQPQGQIELILLKGQELHFQISEEHRPNSCQYTRKKPVGSTILGNFYLREVQRLLFTGGMTAILLGYLVWMGGLPATVLLLPPGLCMLMLVFSATVGSRRFHQVFDALPMRRQEQLQAEFSREHPIVPLFLGEVHLLSNCLISRHGGRLALILIEEITSAQKFQASKSYGLARSLILHRKNGRNYQLEFFGKHQKELPMVLAWLKERNPSLLEL